MGNKIEGNIACDKCYSLSLIEILSDKKNILIRTYCFRGEKNRILTTNINHHILTKYNFYKKKQCIDYNKEISKYCYNCRCFL